MKKTLSDRTLTAWMKRNGLDDHDAGMLGRAYERAGGIQSGSGDYREGTFAALARADAATETDAHLLGEKLRWERRQGIAKKARLEAARAVKAETQDYLTVYFMGGSEIETRTDAEGHPESLGEQCAAWLEFKPKDRSADTLSQIADEIRERLEAQYVD